jgi:carbon storage regulator
MLVLSRNRDDKIMIGDNIEITVVDIRGDKVRLGINAPRDVKVHRKEIYDAIQREKTEARTSSISDVRRPPAAQSTYFPQDSYLTTFPYN